MKKITGFLLKHSFIMPSFFALLCVIGALTLPLTKVNYDQSKYLPGDTQTAKGIVISNEEFGEKGSLNVMIKSTTPTDALEFKRELEKIEGVESVVWLDDILQPFGALIPVEDFLANFDTYIDYITDETVKKEIESYYNGDAFYSVMLSGKDYDDVSIAAIESIDKLGVEYDKTVYLSGPAAKTYSNVKVIFAETLRAILLVVPLALIILGIATNSFIKPFLFLLIIGVSVWLNMASNFIFGEISYLTQATAAILQMALTVDYMIILSNRFEKEKESEPDIKKAMANAVKNSVIPITASSLTTVAGFVALMFMRYSIGFDMGIVLTKGILLSLITVFALMPSLLILTNKIIEKTSHKTLKLSFKGLFNLLKKSRFILPALLLIVIVAAAWAQYQNDFVYGDSSAMGGKGSRLYADNEKIEESFGVQNQHLLLVPLSQLGNEEAAAAAFAESEYVERINSYSLSVNMAESALGLLGQTLSEQELQQIRAQFAGDNYIRMILYLNIDEEGEESFAAIKELRELAAAHFDEYYLLGPSASVLDIKEVTDYDYTAIMALSIGLVLLILVFSFKSIVLPVLLVLVIQGSIWINFAYPYVFGQQIIFIGCVMVSSIQLGSTIDYGIVLGDRYLIHRKTMGKFEAALESLQENKHTVITSASIMCAAGFALSIASSMPSVAIMGVLVGRGALSSGLLVLTLLPQLFMLFDKPITATTLKGDIFKIFKRRKNKAARITEKSADNANNNDIPANNAENGNSASKIDENNEKQ